MKKIDKITRKPAIFLSLTAILSIAVLGIVLTTVLAAPLISHIDPNQVDLTQMLQDSSGTHWLGTDNTGRDIFTRLLYGGRTTLLGAVGVTAIAALVGIPLGLLCGYFRGLFDTIVMRLWDINLSIPTLLLAMVFAACFGKNLTNMVIALGIIHLPMMTRLARSLVLAEQSKTYVEAARSFGFSDGRILFLQILPNCVPTLIVQIAVSLANAVLDLAALNFLGLGVQAPTADWGMMLQEGQQYLLMKPALALLPGLAIVVTIIAIHFLCDGLQTRRSPKARPVHRNAAQSVKKAVDQEKKSLPLSGKMGEEHG